MGCTSSKQFIREKRRKGKQAQIDSNLKSISPTDSEASKQSPTTTETKDTKSAESTTTPAVTTSIFGPGGKYDQESNYDQDDTLTNDVDDDAQDIEQETYMDSNTEGPSGAYKGRRGGVDLTNNAQVNAGKATEYGERSAGSGEQNRYLMADQYLELIKDDLPDKKDLPVYEGEEVAVEQKEGGMKKVSPKTPREELASVETIAQEMFDDVARSMGIRTNNVQETIIGRVEELS